MTTYPVDHPVAWRSDIPPRKGAQTGVLSRPWDRFNAFPWIIWDGETSEHQCLPECVEPAPLSTPSRLKPVAVAHSKNAWDEYKPAERRVRS